MIIIIYVGPPEPSIFLLEAQLDTGGSFFDRIITHRALQSGHPRTRQWPKLEYEGFVAAFDGIFLDVPPLFRRICSFSRTLMYDQWLLRLQRVV